VEFTRQAAAIEKRLHAGILYRETQEGEKRFEKWSLAAWSVVLQKGSHHSGNFSAIVIGCPMSSARFSSQKSSKMNG
jgi:hypothetical protein